MSQPVRTVNLKAGMPRADEAKARLELELQHARRAGTVALKLIHGYGSTGVGGTLRTAIRSELETSGAPAALRR